MWSKFLRWRTAWRVVGEEQSIGGSERASSAREEGGELLVESEARESPLCFLDGLRGPI